MYALIVDDDPAILTECGERLNSLGHSFDTASTQNQARDLLLARTYDYVLLDLSIPVSFGAKPRLVNGQNLLAEIRERNDRQALPVIVMTAHELNGHHLSTKVMKSGATDFVGKPFGDHGDDLEAAIEEALTKRSPPDRTVAENVESVQDEQLEPFEGGVLSLGEHDATLCGVKLCRRDSLAWTILNTLAEQAVTGKYRSFSGDQLADLIRCERGAQGVASAIYELRASISESFAKERQIQVERQDVVQSGSHGYRLASNIQLAVGEPAYTPSAERDDEPEEDTRLAVVAPAELDDRCRWILDQIRSGNKVFARDVSENFDCSESTARRSLATLRDLGLIRYEGNSQNGYWVVNN